MPNHVDNVLTFEGDSEKIKELLHLIKCKDEPLGSVDFGKLIPMPESLNIESGSRTIRGLQVYREFVDVYTLMGTEEKDLLNIPEESEQAFLKVRKDVEPDEWELGKIAFQNKLKYGATDWYDWCIENWGTKWNAYDYGEVDENDNEIYFYTAWSAPHPIIEKLASMFPELQITHKWADENLGYNCGQCVFEGGELTEEYYPEGDEAFRFACLLEGYEPEDLEM